MHRVSGHHEISGIGGPLIGDEPVRSDRCLEARLPFPRSSRRYALSFHQRRHQQTGHRQGGRIPLCIERRIAKYSIAPDERTEAANGLRDRDQRADQRCERRAPRSPEQRDQNEEHERQIGEPDAQGMQEASSRTRGKQLIEADQEQSAGDRATGERRHGKTAGALQAQLCPGCNERRDQ